MYRIVLSLFIILFSGCSVKHFFITEQLLNQVTVVKYAPYMKHHRVYFTRKNLHIFPNGKKYIYFYNNKKNILGILLHRKDKYLFYILSKPNRDAILLNTNSKINYPFIIKHLRRQNFRQIKSPKDKGYLVSVSLQRYKEVKTLLVNIKDYSKLQQLYRTSLKTYNAEKIQHIKAKLPKQLISYDYNYYKNKVKTKKEKKQFEIIAQKLRFKTKSFVKKEVHKHKTTTIKKELPKQKKITIKKELPKQEKRTVKKELPKQEKIIKERSYTFYLEKNTLDQLSSCVSKNSENNTLSCIKYKKLQEEKLLREGTLEELISAYKVNKNIKYKKRIMSLMKAKQKNQ